jgi:hypothetical protein
MREQQGEYRAAFSFAAATADVEFAFVSLDQILGYP